MKRGAKPPTRSTGRDPAKGKTAASASRPKRTGTKPPPRSAGKATAGKNTDGKVSIRSKDTAKKDTARKDTARKDTAGGEASTGAPASPRRPRGRPRQVPLEEQRERILAAATRVFASEGFVGTTSERIAEVSGVGRPSVYQLFGSKNDVFIAAVDRALMRMLDTMRRSFRTTASLRGRKQSNANIAAYMGLAAEEPDLFRMLMLADASGDNATRDAAKAIRRRLQDGLANYIRATWEGFQDLQPRDADLMATLIVAAVEAAAVYHLERPDRSTAETVSFVADFVWSGIYDLAVGHDIPAGRKPSKTK